MLVTHSPYNNATGGFYTIMLYTGNVPMVLTNVVSPPGSYSVRIEASPGVEATVSYTITDSDSDGETH